MSAARRSWRATGALALAALLAGCTVGPDYVRPPAPAAAHFKEAEGWSPSHPADAIDKGAWWSMFNDPVLDSLERRVAVSNQTVKQYEAAYRQAHQIVAEARASFFPTVGATGAITESKGATGTTTGTGTPAPSSRITSTSAVLDASWAPDLWGRVRRTVESDKALAQASAADLANARLAAQSSLAEDYFELRVLDEEAALYRQTVSDYSRYVQLTTNQYTYGTQARSAVITAQSQLYAAQASLINVGVARAQMEHAIAVLTGAPPSELSLKPASLSRNVPVAPLSVPSTLLERRPDIAAAERQVASANALIGVAVSAYYPNLTLSGDYGFGASNLGDLFKSASSLWSVGATLSETVLDFGLHRAQVRAARAVYDEDVAAYRQTVLTAFQGVEDQLAALRIYEQEQDVLLRNEAAARQAVQLDLNEYKEGTVDYTTVIIAQAAALAASQNVLIVLQERLQASVLLVENLGGGWSKSDLPAD